MEVKTAKGYTHVLNVAVEGPAVGSNGCRILSQTAGLARRAGRPKTGRASCWTRQKSLQEKGLPPQSGNRRIRLRPTGPYFIQEQPIQELNAESGLTLMTSPFSFDVFLSHSHGSIDNAVVRAVAQRLCGDGLPVWPDAWELGPGDCIPANIVGRN